MEEQQKVYFFAYADEQEQIAQIHNYLTQKGAKLNPLKEKLENDDRFNAVMDIIKGSKVLAKDDEMGEVFNSILSVLIGFGTDEAHKLIQAWSEVARSPEFDGHGFQSNAGHVVTLFSNLFQFYDQHPTMKSYIYKILLELSGRAKVTKSLDISTPTLKSYFDEWNLNVEEQRDILRILHSALIADDRAPQAAEVMTRLLQTYTQDDAAKAEADARECVRTAIIDPRNFSFDHLLRIHAVKNLEKTHPILFKLLKIFSYDRLNEFKGFVKENSTFISNELKVDEAALLKKIKILTLISMAEQNKNLSYVKLQKELEFGGDEELEKFLIDVLQSKAVTGKLNGVRKEFYITDYTQRYFDRKEWQQLRNRVQGLIDDLKITKKNVEIASDPRLIDERMHYI